MSVNEAIRSAEFRMAYWQRIEELVGLMNVAAQQRAPGAAKGARLGRKTVKRFKVLVEDAVPGPLSEEAVDRIASRYALWTVRSKFDWGRYPAGLGSATRRIDEEICSGVFDLDVRLRRQVEDLLLTQRNDAGQAAHLRSLIEARAGELAATLDLGRTVADGLSRWDEVAEAYDTICDDLDWLLGLAGSPRP